MAGRQVHEHQPQGESLPPEGVPVVSSEEAAQALEGDGTMADLCVLIERMCYGGNYAGMYGELFDRLQIAICDQNPYR